MRQAQIERKTRETEIRLTLDLDGRGESRVETGCGFLDHMLTLFAAHGRFDLDLVCRGDVEVDDHHTVEDVGIALGQAFAEALDDKKGIARYGWAAVPMDEALILTAVDLSGRSALGFDLPVPTEKVGQFDTELVKEFWLGFTRNAACAVHIRKISGENSHHIIEGAFKSAARSLRAAVRIDPDLGDELPTTKGLF